MSYSKGKTSFMFKIFTAFILSLIIQSCSTIQKEKEIISFLNAQQLIEDSNKILDGYELLEGCLTTSNSKEINEEDLKEYESLIINDDILNIVIYHPTNPSYSSAVQYINQTMGGFRVVNGYIYIPFLDPVSVENLTLREAESVISQECKKNNIQATVYANFALRSKQYVTVAGMANNPFIFVDGKRRLFEVLSLAQISPQAGLYSSYILRNEERLDIDFYRLLILGDMSHNIVMKPGDKIYIGSPKDKAVCVCGEVGIKRVVPLRYGFIPLKNIIVDSGGIPFTGDKNHIYIIRNHSKEIKIYEVSWSLLIEQPNDRLLVKAGDVVYVSKTAINEWNILLQQLSGTFTALGIGVGICNWVH